MSNSKQQTLSKIRDNILADDPTPELRKQATQLVFSDGHADSEVVFIGEAPGKNEDLQGKPFVGAAGKFLDEMLEMIGLNRSDIYITNIVKYRPPNNRDPLPEEKQVFLPYLMGQLKAIGPKLVVTLGRHSLNCFLPDLSISQVHGQPKRVRFQLTKLVGGPGVDAKQGDGEQQTESYTKYGEGATEPATQQRATSNSKVPSSAREQDVATWVILPLFHPAAALYNGGMRQTLIDDFAKIPLIINKI